MGVCAAAKDWDLKICLKTRSRTSDHMVEVAVCGKGYLTLLRIGLELGRCTGKIKHVILSQSFHSFSKP